MPQGGVLIGLDNVVYAKLSTDDIGSTATYEAPISIPGAISAKVNPNSSADTLFADDGPFETSTTLGKIQLDLNVADLPIEAQADLLGHTLSGGVLIRKGNDIPPFVAIGFRTLKSNGHYRYTWLSKGKFDLPQEDNQSKASSVKFQTPTISGHFVMRASDKEWERHIDEDSTNFVPSMATDWFNDPFGGNHDTTPPTATIVPADAATAVADNSSVTWTFDEALALSTVTTGTFMVVKDADGSTVAGTLSIDAARKVVTFTPSAAFAAATVYRAIATQGITDLAGNHFAGEVTKFTTA